MPITLNHAKLFCLLAVTAICFGSFFTSQGISMRNPTIRMLSLYDSSVHSFCKEPRNAAESCSTNQNNNNDCGILNNAKEKCERVLDTALRDINMGGCPKQLTSMFLCFDEWCYHGQPDPMVCKRECAGVRENLSVCVRDTVERYFAKNHLNENGTAAAG